MIDEKKDAKDAMGGFFAIIFAIGLMIIFGLLN
jgi:hypothetical protein